MYLLPWQIFVLGCICGVVISLIVFIVLILRIAVRGGVKVEHKIVEREEDNDNE